jgi:hypothetical protein
MSCYICHGDDVGQCKDCGRFYCPDHGDIFCVKCPDETSGKKEALPDFSEPSVGTIDLVCQLCNSFAGLGLLIVLLLGALYIRSSVNKVSEPVQTPSQATVGARESDTEARLDPDGYSPEYRRNLEKEAARRKAQRIKRAAEIREYRQFVNNYARLKYGLY